MRLIDADVLIEEMKKTETEYENAMTCPSWLSAFNVISEQSTAYDIDKVVEELEDRVNEANNNCLCEMHENGHTLDFENENGRIKGLKEAIEIVKQGGVADDTCEWEKGSSGYVGYPAYYSKCCTTDSNGLEMQTHIIADWKYCPYCGKKIKVVE